MRYLNSMASDSSSTAGVQPSDAPAEIFVMNVSRDGERPHYRAVMDGPGPHGFMRPGAPKRMAVRYVRADLTGVLGTPETEPKGGA